MTQESSGMSWNTAQMEICIVQCYFVIFRNPIRQEHLANGLVLNPLKLIDLAWKIADSLSVLHDSAIAHRDIKPANIMARLHQY